VKQLALDGVIAPAVQGYGRGSAIEWDEHGVAQVEAYVRIRQWLGDGALACLLFVLTSRRVGSLQRT
jgi:hypothetical protein